MCAPHSHSHSHCIAFSHLLLHILLDVVEIRIKLHIDHFGQLEASIGTGQGTDRKHIVKQKTPQSDSDGILIFSLTLCLVGESSHIILFSIAVRLVELEQRGDDYDVRLLRKDAEGSE